MGNDNDVQALRQMSGLVTPMALRVAVTLGLPDRLRADDGQAATLAADRAAAEPAATATDTAASAAAVTVTALATIDPATIDPATIDPATIDPATIDPAATDPAATDPAATDPVTASPAAAAEPAAAEPAAARPASRAAADAALAAAAELADPATADPVTVGPAAAESTAAEPAAARPASQAAADPAAAAEPAARPVSQAAAAAAEPAAARPAGQAAADPAAAEPHAAVGLLAAELGVDPTALELLLGHLATLGVVERTAAGYRTTEFGALLCEDAGNGLHNLLHHDTAAGRADLAFVDLAHSVRTGEPAYPLRYGQDFWADLSEQPRLRDAFDRQMTWRIQERIPRFVAAVDWARFGLIVDVGGGPGDLLTAVLAANPEVRGHLVDLEVGPARRNLARFEGRAEATEGSFFDPLPEGGDAYVLFDILHDWDDEQAGRVLARVVEAMSAGSRLIVVEAIRGMGASTEMDLIMLVHFGGRERSVEEFERLAEAHGLVLEGVTEVTDARCVLEFRKHPI
ncbi:methyltransferase [Lentzea sp. NPDC054927]